DPILCLEKRIRRRAVGDPLAPEFLDQAILMRAVIALDPPLACGELAAMMRMPNRAHIRQIASAVPPPSTVPRRSAAATDTFFQSVSSAWVLSLPHRLRYLLAFAPDVTACPTAGAVPSRGLAVAW